MTGAGVGRDEGEPLIGTPVRKQLSARLTAEPAEDGAPGNAKTMRARAMTTMMALPTVDEVTQLPVLVVGFLYFKKPLDIDQLRQVLKERLMEIPRFRSVLQLQKKKTVFVERDRDEIPMETMVQDLPIKTKREVDEFCSKVYAERMTDQLPLWRAYTFNNMEDGRNCFCLVVDHAIADGVSLIATLMSVLDDRDESTDGVASGSATKRTAAPPKRAVEPPGCFAKISAAIGGCCDGLIGDQLPGDPPNQLKMKNHRDPGKVKALAQSEHIPVDKLKEVAALWGNCTVNDILMTVLTMALQSYFEKYEPATLIQKFRAIFVISLRPQGVDMLAEEFFGNKFSNGKIQFPMHLKGPKDVLDDCKQQIDYVKMSPAALIGSKLTDIIANSSCMSAQTKMNLVLDLYGKCTAMLSNVMGPTSQVNFCGQPLDDLQFYALSPIGIYFGIVSYNGKCSMGVIADKTCEPDASKLASEWKGAFERLYAAAKA